MRESVKKVLCITGIRQECLIALVRTNTEGHPKSAALDNVLTGAMEKYGAHIVSDVLDDVHDKLYVKIGRGPTDSEIFDAFLDDLILRSLRAAYIAAHATVDPRT